MSRFTSDQKKGIQSISQKVRVHRKLHRTLGIMVLLFLVISAITGWILSWKKSIDLLQPPSSTIENSIAQWKSSEELLNLAIQAMDAREATISTSGVDRMDYRPDKGIVKVRFNTGYWEVQLNCTTGAVLSVEKRYADLIEQIHDGSIIGDSFKLVSMNTLAIVLLIMSLSGFWLWFGPRKIKKIKSS